MADIMQKLMDFFDSNDDLKIFSMNGSRVNPTITPDIFQDYDVVFFTDSIAKYKKDTAFLSAFGEVLLMTEPDDDTWANEERLYPNGEGYTYLVQFKNGERIDFQFLTLPLLKNYLHENRLTKIIGDKEGLVAEEIIPTDQDYWQEQPEKNQIRYSIKEFWWQFNNTLKAICRKEFLLAQFYLTLTREELIHILTWQVSIQEGLTKNYGKKNDLIFQYLDRATADLLRSTFDTHNEAAMLTSLKDMGNLESVYVSKLDQLIHTEFTKEVAYLKKAPAAFLASKGKNKLANEFHFK